MRSDCSTDGQVAQQKQPCHWKTCQDAVLLPNLAPLARDQRLSTLTLQVALAQDPWRLRRSHHERRVRHVFFHVLLHRAASTTGANGLAASCTFNRIQKAVHRFLGIFQVLGRKIDTASLHSRNSGAGRRS